MFVQAFETLSKNLSQRACLSYAWDNSGACGGRKIS